MNAPTQRPARPVHALRAAGAVSGRHAGARRGALARRLHRERVRRARHLRALPDRGAGRRVRQARDHLLARITSRPSPNGGALRAHARRAGEPAPPLLLAPRSRATSSSTCRRTCRSTGRSCASAPRRALIERDPITQLCYVEVDEPDMHKPLGDTDRLLRVLAKDWRFDGLADRLRICCRRCRRSCARASGR